MADKERIRELRLRSVVMYDEWGREIPITREQAEAYLREVDRTMPNDFSLEYGYAEVDIGEFVRSTFQSVHIQADLDFSVRVDSQRRTMEVSLWDYAAFLEVQTHFKIPSFAWIDVLKKVHKLVQYDPALHALAIEELWQGCLKMVGLRVSKNSGWPPALLAPMVQRTEADQIEVWTEQADSHEAFSEAVRQAEHDEASWPPLVSLLHEAHYRPGRSLDAHPGWLRRVVDRPQAPVRISLAHQERWGVFFDTQTHIPLPTRLRSAPWVWAFFLLAHDVSVDVRNKDAPAAPPLRFMPVDCAYTRFESPAGFSEVRWPMPAWSALVDLMRVVRSVSEAVPELRGLQEWFGRSSHTGQTYFDLTIYGVLKAILYAWNSPRSSPYSFSIRLQRSKLQDKDWEELGKECSPKAILASLPPNASSPGRRLNALLEWARYFAPCYATPELGLSFGAAKAFLEGWNAGGVDGGWKLEEVHSARLALIGVADTTDAVVRRGASEALVEEMQRWAPEHPFHQRCKAAGVPGLEVAPDEHASDADQPSSKPDADDKQP